MAESTDKLELARELEKARGRMARNFGELRQDMDVGRNLKQSFHEHKPAYLGGAAVLGLLLAKVPGRKKKIYVEQKARKGMKEAEKAGFWLLALQFIFKTVQPVLMGLVKKQVINYVKSRGAGGEER